MSRAESLIDGDRTVIEVARALSVRQTQGLREAIASAAVNRVQNWMSELDFTPRTLHQVHELVLNKTGVRIVRLTSDKDLASASRTIKSANPALPEQLAFEFERTTEALVIQRADADAKSCSRFVAIIDARADRQSRAWFAERHEPSHLLIGDPGANAIWRRTRQHRPEPIEQVVDSVASAIGFWEPVVWPVLSACLRGGSSVLEALESTRQHIAADASKEASYRAFIEMVERPLVVLWVGDACRKEDEAPYGDSRRSMALRARRILVNSRAKHERISVWPNFQIPHHSVIHLAQRNFSKVFEQVDNLKNWVSERHGPLAPCRVRVFARGSWATIEPF